MPDAEPLTVYDSEKDGYLDEKSYDVAGCRIKKQRLRGGLSDGVDVIEVDNGRMTFTVVPTRGMSLWKARVKDYPGDGAGVGKYDGFDVGWQSPIRGPVHPSFVPLMEPSGLGWLSGFDELLVRCGLESNGPPVFDDQQRLTHPLHGRIGNRPAHRVTIKVDGDEISVTGHVAESRFHFLKLGLETTITTKKDSLALTITDVVTNHSAKPAAMQLLYHVNFGDPILQGGSKFVAPVQRVSPRDARARDGLANWDSYAAPDPAYTEQVYFLELKRRADYSTQVLLKDAAGKRGVGMHYDVRDLPCFTLWKNTGAEKDGFVTGLEPGTNYPNPLPFEREHGRVKVLPGTSSNLFTLGLEFYPLKDNVDEAERQIAAIT